LVSGISRAGCGRAVVHKQKLLFWIQAQLHDTCGENPPSAKRNLGLNRKNTAKMLDHGGRMRNPTLNRS
jgi:hypothetical protein